MGGDESITVVDRDRYANEIIDSSFTSRSRIVDYLHDNDYEIKLRNYGLSAKDRNKIRNAFYMRRSVTEGTYIYINDTYCGLERTFGIAVKKSKGLVKLVLLTIKAEATVNCPKRKIIKETKHLILPDEREVSYESRGLTYVEIERVKSYLLSLISNEARKELDC